MALTLPHRISVGLTDEIHTLLLVEARKEGALRHEMARRLIAEALRARAERGEQPALAVPEPGEMLET